MKRARAARRFQRGACAVLLTVGLTAGATLAQQGWMATQHGRARRDLNAVFFADAKRGWTAGDSGSVLHTTDGGQSWTEQRIATTDDINDIYFLGKEDGYLLAGNRLFNTRDGGKTWNEMRKFLPTDFDGALPELYSIRFADKKRGWMVGSVSRRDVVVDSLVLHTEDGGAVWQRQREPGRSELIHLDFVGEDRGWIVGASGTILHTRDKGRTWIRQRSNTNATLYHVDFRNERVGWAVGERGIVLRTIDGGETWLAVNLPLQRATLLSVKFANEEDGWIVGRGGVILRSNDGGRTWTRQESKTAYNLYALFLYKKDCWAVGGNGTVLHYER